MSSNTTNIQPKAALKPERGTPQARGNYWEITYREDFTPLQPWELKKGALTTETGKTKVEITSEKDTRALNLSKKHFEICDFNHFTLQDSTFADCTFVDCRFVKSNFRNVK